jgi:hypothetical protein
LKPGVDGRLVGLEGLGESIFRNRTIGKRRCGRDVRFSHEPGCQFFLGFTNVLGYRVASTE